MMIWVLLIVVVGDGRRDWWRLLARRLMVMDDGRRLLDVTLGLGLRGGLSWLFWVLLLLEVLL